MDPTAYKDKNYAKKHKDLCKYCSYRVAVPSKNSDYCSEICRLLHLSICCEDLNIEDIAKLIKLSKVELIEIILTLKTQNITTEDLHKILNKPYMYKQNILKVNNTPGFVNFD